MQSISRSSLRALLVLAAFAGTTGGAMAATDRAAANRLLANEADGTNWASYGRGFSENHFSPLTEINDGNVARLGLAWYYDLTPTASVYSAPLAVDGILYFAVGYSRVHAMDARTGKLLWQYDPHAPEVSGMKLRGGWGTRGIAYWQGKVYAGTHDGRLIALDAKSGKLLWSVQTTDLDDTRYVTCIPWVFNGKVVLGHGGSDFEAVRGYITAYDASTGKQAWRFYTVPGDPKKPYESAALRKAAATWQGDTGRFGGAGGTVWGSMAYDPKFNRLYFGTSNGFPWNSHIRGGGDNLYLASIVAVDADTGRYAWHYQVNPGDQWDYDADTDIELATLKIDGKSHDVMMQASKNGFFYVIDRRTGKPLSAGKFTKATWADRIDIQTGRPVEAANARYENGTVALLFPAAVGAHATQAMAYSPITELAYVPTTELGGVYGDPDGDLSKWQPRPNMATNAAIGGGKSPPAIPPGKSSLVAWSPLTQRAAWSVPLQGTVNGGVTSTAGNLVLQGQVTGELSIYAGYSGRKLWSFDAQTAVIGQPITYLAGGRQYVTVIAGWRGMGSASGVKPEWEYRLQPRRVLTFVLGGEAKLPPPGPRSTPFVDDPAFVIDPAKAALGKLVTGTHCSLCHGVALASGGTAPDLRKSQIPLSKDALTAVLHDGALVPNGMPKFGEFTPEQIEGIQHWIRTQARAAMAAAK